MKKIIFSAFVAFLCAFNVNGQEYKVITSVESIVSSGLGRSRIIDGNEKKDYAQ